MDCNKKTFVLFFILISMVCGNVSATEFYVNGFRFYVISEKEKEVGIGRTSSTSMPNVVIPSHITYEEKTYTVKHIMSTGFRSCDELVSVSIPGSITEIKSNAFDNCPNLGSIYLPYSINNIVDNAFSNTPGLSSIVVDPNNSKYDSRDNCNAVIETASNTLIVGCKETIIPNSVKTIGKGAFNGSALTSVNIPASVTSIEGYAFYCCSKLTSVVIPDGVQKLGEFSFDHCDNLVSVYVSGSVKEIGGHAFGSCKALTEITLEEGVTSLGSSVFDDCMKLKKITLPSTLTDINSNAFYSFYDCLQDVYNLSPIPQSSNGRLTKKARVHVLKGCGQAYKNSTAWASYDIVEDIEPESMVGDVDGDGVVNINDVSAVINVICGGAGSADKADVNNDGIVNINDVSAVINIICGGN